MHVSLNIGKTFASQSNIEVEKDSHCRRVLEARMMEGELPRCEIFEDVVQYSPSGGALLAEALLAGFPCQAQSIACTSSVRVLVFSSPSAGQDVSQAGQQLGMEGSRTCLIQNAFDIWDKMPNRTHGTFTLAVCCGA